MQQLTETHLASEAELQSVIDFLSGYPVSTRSLQQRAIVGLSPCPCDPLPYDYKDFDCDLFDGFVPPSQWPPSYNGGGNNARSPFGSRCCSGSVGRTRSGMRRSSRDSGFGEWYQEERISYGSDVTSCAAIPARSRSLDWRLNGRVAGANGRPGERMEFTSGFDMVQQGIEPVALPALSHEQRFSRPGNTKCFNSSLRWVVEVHT